MSDLESEHFVMAFCLSFCRISDLQNSESDDTGGNLAPDVSNKSLDIVSDSNISAVKEVNNFIISDSALAQLITWFLEHILRCSLKYLTLYLIAFLLVTSLCSHFLAVVSIFVIHLPPWHIR